MRTFLYGRELLKALAVSAFLYFQLLLNSIQMLTSNYYDL